jgi:predicted DNA-binding transcriptional regulator YafY
MPTIALDQAYRILYVNREGEPTVRTIQPLYWESGPETPADRRRLRAFCFLRQETRTFYADRIDVLQPVTLTPRERTTLERSPQLLPQF